ncbi:MAG: hypothetical protein SFV15_09415 [Polyangiaceae bacterium]|nr:hypothetical protein [Polyangiaceae bacterium]
MRLSTRLSIACLLIGTAAGCLDSGPVCLNPQPDLPGCGRESDLAAAPMGTQGTSAPGASLGTGGASGVNVDPNAGVGSPSPTGVPGATPPPNATGGSAASGGSASAETPPGAAGAQSSTGGTGGVSNTAIMSGGAAGAEP